MSEYTKGPWHVGGRHKCTVYDEYGQRVADAFEGVMATQRTDAGCRTNARLISAAPELLEALQALYERYLLAIGNEGPEATAARLAISKATAHQQANRRE